MHLELSFLGSLRHLSKYAFFWEGGGFAKSRSYGHMEDT